MLSRIYLCYPGVHRVAALLPESECKGKANFETDKLLEKKISIIFKLF